VDRHTLRWIQGAIDTSEFIRVYSNAPLGAGSAYTIQFFAKRPNIAPANNQLLDASERADHTSARDPMNANHVRLRGSVQQRGGRRSRRQ
jgi:hypothetical protein